MGLLLPFGRRGAYNVLLNREASINVGAMPTTYMQGPRDVSCQAVPVIAQGFWQ